MEFIKDQQGV